MPFLVTERRCHGPAPPCGHPASQAVRKKELYAGGEEWIGKGS